LTGTSFSILIAALTKIYISLKNQTSMIVNVNQMLFHVAAFALYLVSDLLVTFVDFNQSKSGSN